MDGIVGVDARLGQRQRQDVQVRFGERLAAVLDAERPARDPYGDDPDDFLGDLSDKPPVPIVENLDDVEDNGFYDP